VGGPAWMPRAVVMPGRGRAGRKLRGSALSRKQRGEFGNRQRLRKEIALRLLAAEPLQIGDLLGSLDTFGDDRQAEGSRHLDDGTDNGGIAVLVLDAGHERGLDL